MIKSKIFDLKSFITGTISGVASAIIFLVLTSLFSSDVITSSLVKILFSGIFGGIIAFLLIKRQYDIKKERFGIDDSLDHQEYKNLISLQRRLIRATTEIIKPLPNHTHPIVKILEGWYSQTAKDLEHGGVDMFELDSDYYKACLESLHKTPNIRAVADLSVPIESFWDKNHDPQKTIVEERIFLLDWRVFFNADKLHQRCQLFQKHSRLYNIKVRRAPLKTYSGHFKFKESKDRNLLLIPPDLVGGYIENNEGRSMLRIVKHQISYNQAEEEFRDLNEGSIEFKKDMTYQDLKKEWIENEGIGKWQEDWGKVEVASRSPEYFNKYDMHIRCWVPEYDQFITRCYEIIKIEINKLVRETDKQIKILEIGYGTGAVTKPLLEWVGQLNETLNFGFGQQTISYIGIDKAEQRMRPHLNRHIHNLGNNYEFVEGSAWDSIPYQVDSDSPFDIIFGSLVLHDIVSGHPGHKFEQNLLKCIHYSSDHSRFIFADVFTSPNEVERNNQRERWQQWMIDNGLSKFEAKFFLDENKDMIDTVNEEHMVNYAKKYGFTYEFYPVGPDWSPFKILVLRRNNTNISQTNNINEVNSGSI